MNIDFSNHVGSGSHVFDHCRGLYRLDASIGRLGSATPPRNIKRLFQPQVGTDYVNILHTQLFR